MSKLQWTAVVGVLGLGILAQIPQHDHEGMPAHELVVGAVPEGHTVILAVSGMT